MPQSVISEHITITLETLAKQGIPGQNKEKQNNDKNTICLPRQCLRDGEKALILMGFLDENVKFTPLEDRIGSQDMWRLKEICSENLELMNAGIILRNNGKLPIFKKEILTVTLNAVQ